MVSDVTHISKILMTLLDKKIAKQPIGTSKKLHMVFKTNLLGLKLAEILFVQLIWYPINSLREPSSVSDCRVSVGLPLDHVETKQLLLDSVFHNLSIHMWFIVITLLIAWSQFFSEGHPRKSTVSLTLQRTFVKNSWSK